MAVKLGVFSRGLLVFSGIFFLIVELLLLITDAFAAFLWLFISGFIWIAMLRISVFMNDNGDTYEYKTTVKDTEDELLEPFPNSRIIRQDRSIHSVRVPKENNKSPDSDKLSEQKDINKDIADFLRSIPF